MDVVVSCKGGENKTFADKMKTSVSVVCVLDQFAYTVQQ